MAGRSPRRRRRTTIPDAPLSTPAPPPLGEEDVRRGLAQLLWEGLATQVFVSLCTGVFLVGLALELNASNLVIGVLAAMPFLSQLVQLPAILLVERYRARRPITVVANALGRSLLLVIALTPLIADRAFALWLLVGAVTVRLCFAAVANCAWNSWMRDLVPEKSMGAFYAKRMLWMAAVAAALTLVAGIFIDLWTDAFHAEKAQAYTVLFIVGGIAALVSVGIVARIPEPAMQPVEHKATLLSVLAEPWNDRNFRRLLGFLASWEFAANLAAPFFTVYMLKRLGYPMSLVILFSVLSQLANIAVFRFWGDLTDRYSNKSVLAVSGPIFIACIFGWTFVTFPEPHAFTIPLLVALHVLMGLATAGVTISTNNIGLKLAPKGKATAYLACRSLAVALAGGIAPIIGGACADLVLDLQFTVAIRWETAERMVEIPALIFKHWDFFFLFAFVLGLYSMHRLSLVREEGEVAERIIVEELITETRRTIGNLSTVAGLRAAAMFPLDQLRARFQRPD